MLGDSHSLQIGRVIAITLSGSVGEGAKLTARLLLIRGLPLPDMDHAHIPRKYINANDFCFSEYFYTDPQTQRMDQKVNVFVFLQIFILLQVNNISAQGD